MKKMIFGFFLLVLIFGAGTKLVYAGEWPDKTSVIVYEKDKEGKLKKVGYDFSKVKIIGNRAYIPLALFKRLPSYNSEYAEDILEILAEFEKEKKVKIPSGAWRLYYYESFAYKGSDPGRHDYIYGIWVDCVKFIL